MPVNVYNKFSNFTKSFKFQRNDKVLSNTEILLSKGRKKHITVLTLYSIVGHALSAGCRRSGIASLAVHQQAYLSLSG